ncbi:hypothetical protein RTBOTA2_005476 [Rhodotorula toruloides]|uniref:Uncharacterized protein n=1 Tax=Rhodotorula toruloides TaxID=5286 RepID=A0A0K3CRM8_RHOTO|nr:hypothetical protein RTBOTA2_005476 [Rhodotorula toruloides]
MTRTRSAPSLQQPRPYPRPRQQRKPLSADPALDSIGAVYVGWGAGKRDPAPLCCPVQAKASLVKRFGEAAVGWLSVAPQIPQPRPVPSQSTSFSSSTSASQRITTLPLGSLPPLPPLPPPLPKTSAATPLRSSSSASPAPHPSSSSSASSSRTSLTGFSATPPISYTTSTPPDYSSSSSRDYSPPLLFEEACQSGFDDTTLALPLVESRPASPKLAPTSILPLSAGQSFGFSLALSTVLEDLSPSSHTAEFVSVKREEDELSEALWSAGEDPLGNCAATDVMSEASWAW